MAFSDIQRQICKRVTQCLLFRYCYYIRCSPLVSDTVYDGMERDLRVLVREYPEDAKKVLFVSDVLNAPGSDLLDSYPRAIEQLAESLLDYVPRFTRNTPAVKRNHETNSEQTFIGQHGLFD